MFIAKSKEFPDETKAVEFTFDSGIASNRLRMFYNSHNTSYMLYENYGNPNYIDVSKLFIQNFEDNTLVNFIDLEEIINSNENANSCLDSVKRSDSFSNLFQHFYSKLFSKAFGRLYQDNSVDKLGSNSLNSKMITMMRVSNLSKYALFQFDSSDLVFLNLKAKSKLKITHRIYNFKARS
jgi:hypothetical protein